jgi:hypothetical protein
MKTYAKIGQIQWLLFWISLVDHKFLIVWVISLFMENKE